MNSIQLALLRQGVSAAWSGPEPEGINKITRAYLEGEYKGWPRMVRDMDDTAHPIKLSKLKTDWKEIHDEQLHIKNAKTIKNQAVYLISSTFSQQEQLNLITKSIRLNAKKPTKVEKEELSTIYAYWDWIDSILDTANTAIEEKMDPNHVKWAKSPK